MAKAAHATSARRIDYGCARDENRPNAGASDELLASVIASALDTIVVMDADGRITEFNPSAERVFGYRRQAAIGALLSELLIPPELRSAHQDGLRRFLLLARRGFSNVRSTLTPGGRTERPFRSS